MSNPTFLITKITFWRNRITMLAIMTGGFAVRLYALGRQSLWYDETVSAFLASKTAIDLVAHTARDIHPPGYYLSLHGWTMLVGSSPFSLTLFSVGFGLLLIPLTYSLARLLANEPVALWSAVLVAVSPYHLWYSQEVRMYTLGAALGVAAAYCLIKAVRQDRIQYWLGYALAAIGGLYTLYYFAFLLVAINSFIVVWLLLKRRMRRGFVVSNLYILIAYGIWIPTAYRQVTNPPVPPWRAFPRLTDVIIESWTALSLGQSVEPQHVWPILLLTLALACLGLVYFQMRTQRFPAGSFLLTYTFGPLLLMILISFAVPLYHVRYLFTYAAAFSIVLGAGLVWLSNRATVWSAVIVAALIVSASFYSIHQFHSDPQYRADDFRGAVEFIEQQWQPGDALMVNAGYVYPAFLTYADAWADLQTRRLVPYPLAENCCSTVLWQTGTVDGPAQLGWGDPQADFYAMESQATINALELLSQSFTRLWLLRAYDTVTDPDGLVRAWLAENAVPIEDQPFSGESNIRVQGFLFPSAVPQGTIIRLEDNIALSGSTLPQKPWTAGQTIPVKLWWTAIDTPSADYKASLKLWSPDAQLAAQGQDEWPGGTIHRATTWSPGETVYHPMDITLPPDLPAGQYWLNVELYHPETVQPLHRLDNGEAAITLGAVVVE
ncbi:MAG: glycosyltransferase family 39 protein [Anaerolineae bacterium]|nr:glycosyltransferase family 39 protein [Anaerolineae bacterium]